MEQIIISANIYSDGYNRGRLNSRTKFQWSCGTKSADERTATSYTLQYHIPSPPDHSWNWNESKPCSSLSEIACLRSHMILDHILLKRVLMYFYLIILKSIISYRKYIYFMPSMKYLFISIQVLCCTCEFVNNIFIFIFLYFHKKLT